MSPVNEEYLPEEEGMGLEPEIPEDMGEEAEAPVEEEEAPATVMSHTVEEIPELEGLGIGDSITMVISNVTDDGKYELQVQVEPPVPTEAPPVEGAEGVEGAGVETLTERLI